MEPNGEKQYTETERSDIFKNDRLIVPYENVIPALSVTSYGLFNCLENSWIESHSLNFDPPYFQGRNYLRKLVKNALTESKKNNWNDNNLNAILAIDQGFGNYYHFLVNQLPFIVTASRLHPEISLIVLNDTKKFMLEYLQLFDINSNVTSLRDKSIRLSRCIASSMYLPKSKFAGHQPLIQIAGKVKEATAVNSVKFKSRSEKVYIERKSSSNGSLLRKVYPNDDFHAWLINNNFSIVYLEDLSVEEQIHIFKTSRVIAAVHGAALTNIIFCDASTAVIEIHHKDSQLKCFQNIAMLMKLRKYQRVACPGFLTEEKENELKSITGNSINALPLKSTEELLDTLSSC